LAGHWEEWHRLLRRTLVLYINFELQQQLRSSQILAIVSFFLEKMFMPLRFVLRSVLCFGKS